MAQGSAHPQHATGAQLGAHHLENERGREPLAPGSEAPSLPIPESSAFVLRTAFEATQLNSGVVGIPGFRSRLCHHFTVRP